MTDDNLEATWQDVSNLFEDAINNELSEIHLLEEEVRAYVLVMNQLMTQYGAYAFQGYFDTPDWFTEQYPVFSNTYKAIKFAVDNSKSITLTLDEVTMQYLVIQEFVHQLLPIKLVLEPEETLSYLIKPKANDE